MLYGFVSYNSIVLYYMIKYCGVRWGMVVYGADMYLYDLNQSLSCNAGPGAMLPLPSKLSSLTRMKGGDENEEITR